MFDTINQTIKIILKINNNKRFIFLQDLQVCSGCSEQDTGGTSIQSKASFLLTFKIEIVDSSIIFSDSVPGLRAMFRAYVDKCSF